MGEQSWTSQNLDASTEDSHAAGEEEGVIVEP